jgi:hypothetical protein
MSEAPAVRDAPVAATSSPHAAGDVVEAANAETEAVLSASSAPLSRGRRTRRAAAPASAQRTSAARLKADFEHSLVSCLLFNTLYLYYCDARLLVLFIRSTQILRLLYFPYESPPAQRSTSLLLVMSNIPVLLIHGAIIADGRVGDMLLINFIGPEPHPLPKLFYVDAVTMVLQAALASVAAGDELFVTSPPTAAALPAAAEPPAVVEEAGADAEAAAPSEAAALGEDGGDGESARAPLLGGPAVSGAQPPPAT